MTKRSLIQFIPSIFNPLGLLNPVIVKLNILFQDVFHENFAWDGIFPKGFLSVFYDTVNGLHEVQKVLFKRVYYIQTIEGPTVSVQILVFAMPRKEPMDVAFI